MKGRFRPTKLLTLATFFVLFTFVFVSFVSAINPSQPRVLPSKKASPSAKAKGRDKMKNRLTEVKLKVCEKKEATIQRRSTKLVARSEKIISNFDRIARRVDNFYVDKLSPAGFEIENYDHLLNNLENKRRDVDAAVGVAEGTAENFTCEGVSPKEQMSQFKTDMKGVIRALQAYKKAIINYLVTVKTKAKNFKAETATSSAEPATDSADPATGSAE
jgi:hypothetical protein